jgi:predicted metal-dependent HD superfamily phosphohydrolase
MVNNPFQRYHYLLQEYIDARVIPVLYEYWTRRDRHWHNLVHLNDMISYIEGSRHRFDRMVFEQLILAAFFHDAVYDTRETKMNEERSKDLFRKSYIGKNQKFTLVDDAIECTKYRTKPPVGPLRIFWEADNQIFRKDWMSVLRWEKGIRKEYGYVSDDIYKAGRIKFLNENLGLFGPKGDTNIRKLTEYLRDK